MMKADCCNRAAPGWTGWLHEVIIHLPLDRVEIKKQDLISLESFREWKIALSYRNVV